MKYHPWDLWHLTALPEPGAGTLHGGEFDWGGRLPKSNGGARRFPQADWKPAVERKGRRELDCKTNKSNRWDTRP